MSSTFRMSAPPPFTTRLPVIRPSVPSAKGSLLPTFTVFTPAPVLRVVNAPMARTSKVSLPPPPLIVVGTLSLDKTKISFPVASFTFRLLIPL